MLKQFIFIFCVAISIYANASIQVSGLTYDILSEEDKTVEIVEGGSNKTITSVVVPEFVYIDGQEYHVVSVGNRAFYRSTKIESLVMPNSIRTIGDNAFANCTNLKEVGLSNSLLSIGESAFTSTAISSIDIPNSVTELAPDIFNSCKSLTSVTLPNSVEELKFATFANCPNLSTINIPNNLKTLRSHVFSGCKSLTTINLPFGLDSIGEYCFNGSGLKVIRYESHTPPCVSENGLTGISKDCIYVVPEGCSTIFQDSETWSSRIIVENKFWNDGLFLTVLDDASFEIVRSDEYRTIDNLVIPETLNLSSYKYAISAIGNNAFNDCININRIVFSDSIKSIKANAFSGCKSISTVILNTSTPPSLAENAFDEDVKKICYLYVPRYARNTYLDNNAWNKFIVNERQFESDGLVFSVIDNQNVEVVSDSKYKDLKDVTIPELVYGENLLYTVSQIGAEAFYRCSQLKNATLPETIKCIEDNAFNSCKGLSEIVIPDSVTSIGDRAFSACTSLSSLTIGESVTFIGKFAFSSCERITNVNLPNCLENVSQGAFSYCKGLKSVVLGTGIISIENNVFEECSSLGAITFGANIKHIGKSAFNGCEALHDVIFNGDIKDWCEIEFEDSPLLYGASNKLSFNGNKYEWLIFPDGITRIPDYAFYNESNISRLEFPENLLSIGKSAFVGNDGIIEIVAESTNPPVLESQAFDVSILNKCKLLVKEGCFEAYNSANFWRDFIKTIENVKAKSIELSSYDMSILIGNSVQLVATINPTNTYNTDLDWISSDESVASVDDTGFINALKVGESLISVYTKDGSNLVAKCHITVSPILLSSIRLDRQSMAMKEGESVSLRVSIYPSNATNKLLHWSSSDDNVASVNQSGVVSCIKEGTAVITVATTDGSNLEAQCTVNVLSGINAVEADDVNFNVDGRNIIFSGTNVSGITIYNICGDVIYCGFDNIIQMQTPGYYIVKSNNKVAKVIIR